jgi:hypothetical protein
VQRHILLAVLLGFTALPAAKSEIVVGVLSFDIFIAAGNDSPGISAFDVFNLTGPAYGLLASSPYVTDSLTLDNVVLTAFLSGGSPQTFDLGNIDPGELLDSGGNPVVQLPGSWQFSSATLTASLSQTTFTLSDGSTFTASPTISTDLMPSSGNLLVAGLDFSPIYAQPAIAGTPEPGTLFLLPLGLLAVAVVRRRCGI